MSILVKGMEMPVDCPFCPMANWTSTSRFAGCNAVPDKRFVPNTDRDFWDSATRPDWCPLVELKEGGGMNKYDFSKALMLLDKANEQAKAILEEVCQVVVGLKREEVIRNETLEMGD